MGRPLKNPAEGVRVNVMFRLTGTMRDRVAALAAETGYSMSEALERIVEAHFVGQDQRAMMREVVAEALREQELRALKVASPINGERRSRASTWTPEEIAAFGPNRKVIGA